MRPLRLEALRVDRVTVAIRDLPSSLSGIKLVQWSDLHYDGERLPDALLEEAIAVTDRENPDLFLLTGDLITDDPSPIFQLVSIIKAIKSQAGIFACLGNHDNYYPGARGTVTKALTEAGIRVLWNEVATPFGEGFPLVGLADYWSREFAPAIVLEKLDPAIPRLVLSHNPDTAMILQFWRVDLQLSGHTHGGQIALPGIGPVARVIQDIRDSFPENVRAWLPFARQCDGVVKYWQWARGLHRVGENQLYVNRGLGTYFPGRLFCPPEVTVITLIREGSP
ncbi:metallophosphoesterase [Pannus brasiliensis CCIBt3594]|uniref:Metallophosphoesterase n=1 Tax=Pannus brasiliensis CCIBt3594 TaxID=1427578 RepID=A0AAW9QPZ2_9CHRO